MKTAIMAALAASTVVGAIGLSAAPAQARPWGHWHHHRYHAYWRAHHPYWGYRYAYGPAYHYGPSPFWPGYFRPYHHHRFHRW